MGEMIQRKFREMLDSVSNASDEFVNKYFSNDSVDLDIDVSDDTEELTDDDVETIKGETDDWFDYKGNIISDTEELENDVEKIDESIKEEESFNEKAKEDVIDTNNEEITIDSNENELDETTSNDEIESELKDNVDTSAIEEEIKESSLDDLNLNYDYDNMKVEEEIKEEHVQNEETDNDESNTEISSEEVETVKDTQYKKLSGDELIDLLNKIDNGEDFFKEIEV